MLLGPKSVVVYNSYRFVLYTKTPNRANLCAMARAALKTKPASKQAAAILKASGKDIGNAGSVSDTLCPTIAAINVLQEKWVLLIVRELLNGPKGFNELKRDIGHCNPATLSERLDGLVGLGIILKTVQSTMPPRSNYELTKSGVALEHVIAAIDSWSRKHLKQ